MPESPDLGALRELSRLLRNSWIEERRRYAESLDDVLALVEEQRKENERLQGALREIATRKHGAYVCALMADRAIAGSPAENKEPT